MLDFIRKKKCPETLTTFLTVKDSRFSLMRALDQLFKRKQVPAKQLQELEELLLTSDAGISATEEILEDFKQRLSQHADARQAIRSAFLSRLRPLHAPLLIESQRRPFVILVIGVNGSGKTTSVARLAHYFKHRGEKVLIAAGDTFRAAALEQLQVWGERIQIPVIAQPGKKADSASVIYDAVSAARARKYSVLIADTAGRLHNKTDLLGELRKIIRVISKLEACAPHEILLVLDGNNGQNALRQVEEFRAEMRVSGLMLTKLDGTAKGGIAFALTNYGIPIRFIGVGETLESLALFEPENYVDQLLVKV